jgi:hypothetical protein
MPVRGIERVRANFRRTVQKIAAPVTEGAVYAVLSQGRAMADTMTPVDTSNLINSGYAPQITVARGKVTGTVGYTASYAFAVHEAPGTLKGQPRPGGRGDYWDPNAGPRFLVEGFDQLKSSVPAILKAYYRAG